MSTLTQEQRADTTASSERSGVRSDERQQAQETTLAGFSLAAGEEVIDTLEVGGEDRFAMTTERVIYSGGTEEHRMWSFALISEITSAEVSRAPRDKAMLVWGLLGLVAAVGIWQVSTNAIIGVVGGVAMTALSLLLLGDYYFRTPPSMLVFRAAGQEVGGPLSREAEDRSREFADQIMHARARAEAKRQRSASRRRPRFPGA